LLADSSKLGKASFVKFAELAQVDLLITDSGISAETLSELEQMGINVEVARV